jgi:hypothetical protein
MKSRSRTEVVLSVLLLIDLVIGLATVVSHPIQITGSPVIALSVLAVIFVFGVSAAICMLKAPPVGLVLGTLFYGLQSVCALSDGAFVGASWGLAVRFRVWTEPGTQVFLNLWAVALCVAFLVATASRNAQLSNAQQTVPADRRENAAPAER